MMTELLNDIKLKKRIGLKGFSSVADGHAVLDELRWKGSKTGNCWTLAEWSSNRLLKDERFEEVLIGGGIRYRNKMKNVDVFPGEGKIALEVFGSKEYSRPRSAGEQWTHLLMEQWIPLSKQVPLYKLEKLTAQLLFEVDNCDMRMNAEDYDPTVHAAHISWYFTVENSKSDIRDVEGRPDYMWFGLPLYDSRFKKIDGPQVFMDSGTKRLIYGLKRDTFCSAEVETGKKYKVDIDILPQIKRAFVIAKERGCLTDAKWEDMTIGSTNIGWEVPGIFDCKFTYEKMALIGMPAKVVASV